MRQTAPDRPYSILGTSAARHSDHYEQGQTQPLETIIDTLAAYDPQVLGIMHSSVKSMAPGLDVLFERWRGPVMAYPEANGYDAVTRSPLPVGPDDFAAYCRGWVESGVQIIGGCCGTTIHHIRAMVEALPERPGAVPQRDLTAPPGVPARDCTGRRSHSRPRAPDA